MHGPRTFVTRRCLLQGLGATLVGGCAAGCATNPVSGRSELMLLSEEEEIELGRKAFTELAWQQGGPLRIDPATQGYVDGLVRQLHQVSHRPNLPVDFTLESASEPNAWAIPGHTAMNRGLLQHL
jgi:predicted Zn-dependent protease